MTSLFKKSRLFLYLKAEKEEVLKHKWVLSEERGFDVGFDYALLNWKVNHEKKWKDFYFSTSGEAYRGNELEEF